PAEKQRRRGGCDRPHPGATAPARRPGSTRSTGMSTALKRLTPEQRAHFDARGYVAPVDAFSSEEAAEAERRLVALLAPTGGRADTRLRNNPHLLTCWMADLVRDARVLDAVEDILGPDLLVLRTTLFVK